MPREGAEAALKNVEQVEPWVLPAECPVDLEFDHPSRADACLLLPGVERKGDRSVGYVATDGVHLFHTFRALMRLSDVQLSP